MSRFTQRQISAGVLVLLAFSLPYTIGWAWGWWKFGLSSLLIVFLWRWAKPKTFLADLGLRLRGTDLGLASGALLVVGLIAGYAIPAVLRRQGYTSNPHTDLMWKYLAVPFQTLNEEMVLRAFLVTMVAHFVKVRFVVSLAVAVMFTVLHFVLYRFGPPHAALSVQAMTTLFFVGLAFNEFFLATGSIAIPYAIHLGWNLTRFGNDWTAQGSGSSLPDGVDFNLVEGNPQIVGLAVALGLFALAARFRPSARSAFWNPTSKLNK